MDNKFRPIPTDLPEGIYIVRDDTNDPTEARLLSGMWFTTTRINHPLWFQPTEYKDIS